MLLDADQAYKLERLVKNRAEYAKRKRSTAPRGYASSYISGSHNGSYMDACNALNSIDRDIKQLLVPVVRRMRFRGTTWKAVRESLGINATVLRVVRDGMQEKRFDF